MTSGVAGGPLKGCASTDPSPAGSVAERVAPGGSSRRASSWAASDCAALRFEAPPADAAVAVLDADGVATVSTDAASALATAIRPHLRRTADPTILHDYGSAADMSQPNPSGPWPKFRHEC